MDRVTVKKCNNSKSKEGMDNSTSSCLKRKLNCPLPSNSEGKKNRCKKNETSASTSHLSVLDTKDHGSSKVNKDNISLSLTNSVLESNNKKSESVKTDAEKPHNESDKFPKTKRRKKKAKRKYSAPNSIPNTPESKSTSKLVDKKLFTNQGPLLADNKKKFKIPKIDIHCEKLSDKMSEKKKSNNALNCTKYVHSKERKNKKSISDIKIFQPKTCLTTTSLSSVSMSDTLCTASYNSSQKNEVNFFVSSNINSIPLVPSDHSSILPYLLPSSHVSTTKNRNLLDLLPSHVKIGQRKVLPFQESPFYKREDYAPENDRVNKLASEKREASFNYDKGFASNLSSTVFLNQGSSPLNSENSYHNDNTGQNDFEDMDVDDEVMLLSNLQEVRNQASHILNQPHSCCLDNLTTNDSNSKVLEIKNKKPKLSSPHCDITTTHVNSVEINGNSLQKPKSIIIVVDTNVLITSIGFLKQLLKKQITGFGKPILLLPWVVMQELDYLKNRKTSMQKLNDATSRRAAAAVKFIHVNLISKNPQFIGQTAIEAIEPADFELECNDDRLLQCCFQTKKREMESQIILLTRDINLINKALIMGITSADTMTLWSHLNLLNPEHCLNEKPFSDKESHSSKEKAETKASNNLDSISLSSIGYNQITTAPVVTNVQSEVFSSHSPLITTQGGKSEVLQKSTVCHPEQDVSAIQSKPDDNQLILAKFESVWKVIFNVKHQVSSILSQGHSHAGFSAAIEMCNQICSLLMTLKQDFERCLLLSPIILCNHVSDFDHLCALLNSFYNDAKLACADPCDSVTSQQLIHYFTQGKNRSTLSAGLEQLVEFIRDYQNLKNSVT